MQRRKWAKSDGSNEFFATLLVSKIVIDFSNTEKGAFYQKNITEYDPLIDKEQLRVC